MLYYCKKCGRLVGIDEWDKYKFCDYCNSNVNLVPKKFLVSENIPIIDKTLKDQFINEYIKSSPEFDQYLFDHRDQDLYNKRTADARKLAHGKAILDGKDSGNKPTITCPYCKSTDTKKITNTSKAVHTALFGIFSISRNSKQWHCNKCGSDF